jgi:hypothetical protein|tara:strand:- start:207 stop:455 length:249 start_codon:yes stop_codon:yes gene_type:complete
MKKIPTFLAIAFFTTNVCAAATKGIQITTKDGQQIGHYENSYALSIGVSDYTAGWPDLQAAPSELAGYDRAGEEGLCRHSGN